MVFPMVSISFKIKWFLFKEDGLSWSLKVGKLKLKVVVPFGLRFLLRFFGGAARAASRRRHRRAPQLGQMSKNRQKLDSKKSGNWLIHNNIPVKF